MSPQRLPPSGPAGETATAGGNARSVKFNVGEQTVGDKIVGLSGTVQLAYATYKANQDTVSKQLAADPKVKYEIHEDRKTHKKASGERAYEDSKLTLTSKKDNKITGSMDSAPIRKFTTNSRAGGQLLIIGAGLIENADNDWADYKAGKVTATYAADARGNRGALISTVWNKRAAAGPSI